jgi:hypothetical protein
MPVLSGRRDTISVTQRIVDVSGCPGRVAQTEGWIVKLSKCVGNKIGIHEM